MKKILIMTTSMGSGGVEKSLLNFIKSFPPPDGKKTKYQVTLLLIKKAGLFLNELPEWINVREINIVGIDNNDILFPKSIKFTLVECLKKKKYIHCVRTLIRYIKRDPFFYLPWQEIPMLQETYDLAICYHIHFPFNLAYIADKVFAQKKIAWIHNDFSTTHFKIKKFKSFIIKYSMFYAVSNQLVYEFIDLVPQMRNKTRLLYNIVDKDEIVKKSLAYYPQEFYTNSKRILSIGRLDNQKGFDMAIEVSKRLKENNFDFKWFIVGEGSEYTKLSQMIKDCRLEEYIFLLGAKSNPYPYLRNADIYVQPSRHEGYVTTITEAKMFYLPILFTNVAGAIEQIDNNITGLIVEPTVLSLYEGLMKLLLSEDLCKNFSNNLKLQNKEVNQRELVRSEIMKWL